MSANTTQKSAASSTPAAAPSASQAVVDKGADAEEITAGDVLAALGQLSDDSKPAKATDDATEPAEAEVEPAAEVEPEAESGVEAGELEVEPAESGDAAGEASSDVHVDNEPAAQAEPESAGGKPSATQQRINELVARAKTAEEELAKAQERLAAFEASTVGRTDPGVLDHIDSPEQLAGQRRAIVELRQKLMRSPNGLELTVNGKTLTYDAEGVANLLAETEMLVLEAIPAREKFLAERAVQEASAKQVYAWLDNSREGQGAQVAELLKSAPALRKIGPAYKLVAADAVIGRALREAGVAVTPELITKWKASPAKPVQASAAAAIAPRKLPPAAPGRPGMVPARVNPREGASRLADKRLRSSDGSMNALTASIASRL